MDRPRSTHGWKVSWKMLLLAASVLSSCFLLTRAQETTISIRIFPDVLKERERVTLTPEGLDLKAFITCRWYQGVEDERNIIITFFLPPHVGQGPGPAYTDRATVITDCSLVITDLKPGDSGTYSFKSEGPGVISTGATNITVSGSAGALAGTVIGSLAVILVLVGTLTYIFLRVCRRNGKTSTQVVSTPQIYENVLPPGQVHPENSSSTANTYETLQPRIQSVYEEIQG